MKLTLASSLHLDHGGMPPGAPEGMAIPVQCFVPVGLLSLKAAADQALGNAVSIRVDELNTAIARGEIANDAGFHDRIAARLLADSPDFVGLMTDADSLHHTTLIADALRARAPKLLICAGGPTTSPVAKRFLERFDTFDFVVRGEGERTFTELAGALATDGDLQAVAGLTWRGPTDVHHNRDRPLIDDLDDIPIPSFDAYAETGSAALYLDVGRGCPFKCSFCSTAPFWNRQFRMKSSERIIAEMRLLRDRYGRDHVNFSHDLFTANQKLTAQFCDALEAAQLGMTWSCSSRTDTISLKLLERMASAGCDEIYYGIESGAPEIQHRIDKNLDLDQCRRIVAATRDVGIRPVTGLIIGYPFETRETIGRTMRLFFDLLQDGGYRAHLFTLCPFPQAPMFDSHADTLEREAEYHDLPLAGEAGEAARARLRSDHAMFSSQFRFATPDVPAAWINASEEISAHLVLLRRIWPMLLPHYTSPLDMYERWVAWIGDTNRVTRATSRLQHNGDINDLLGFIGEEVVRLRLRGSALASAIRYETIKYGAAAALDTPDNHPESHAALEFGDIVARSGKLLVAAFRHDPRHLVADAGAAGPPSLTHPYWVVFAKSPEGDLNTIRVTGTGRRLIELAAKPSAIGALIEAALLRRPAADDFDREECLRTAQGLLKHNLLAIVRTT